MCEKIAKLECTDPKGFPIALEAPGLNSSSSLDARCWLRWGLLFDLSGNTPSDELVELMVEEGCDFERYLARGPPLF